MAGPRSSPARLEAGLFKVSSKEQACLKTGVFPPAIYLEQTPSNPPVVPPTQGCNWIN